MSHNVTLIEDLDDDLVSVYLADEANALMTNGSSVGDDYRDYTWEETEQINYYDLVPTAVFYGITLIMGLVGNGLIVYTVSHFRRMRTLSNVFLASLASADLLLIVVCVPVKFGQLFSYTWEFGEVCCKLVHYMQNVSAICSVLTLTAMSIERYYAIIHPVRSRYLCTMSQTKRIIIFTWVVAILAAIPVLFIQVHLEVGVKYTAYWCVKDWSRPVLWRIYEIFMLVLVLIIPTIVMTYTYTCICNRLWVVIRQRASMMYGQTESFGGSVEMKHLPKQDGSKGGSGGHGTNGSSSEHPGQLSEMYQTKSEDDTSTVKQVIKMLVAVVVLFFLCWSPILIINVLTSFGYMNALNYGYLKPLRTAAHLLSYLNSCVNPVVYGFMSQNFRASFKAALSKCFGCRSSRQNVISRSTRSASYHANSTLVSRIPNTTNVTAAGGVATATTPMVAVK